MTIAEFNSKYPIGSVVGLEKDDGEIITTKVRERFTILCGHIPVGWFEGIGGCYLADRIREVPEPKVPHE